MRSVLEALEREPVRVLATTNRPDAEWTAPVPANATVVDWLSYAQVMPRASLVVCHGGHGTVARALGEGVPVLVCPAGRRHGRERGEGELGGGGTDAPARLMRAGPMRWAVRRLLDDRGFAARAGAIAAWGRDNDGPAAGASLIERLAGE